MVDTFLRSWADEGAAGPLAIETTDLLNTIIIDDPSASYLHPNHSVAVSPWFNDSSDTELTDVCPFLADLAQVDDVRGVRWQRMTRSVMKPRMPAVRENGSLSPPASALASHVCLCTRAIYVTHRSQCEH